MESLTFLPMLLCPDPGVRVLLVLHPHHLHGPLDPGTHVATAATPHVYLETLLILVILYILHRIGVDIPKMYSIYL